MALYPQNRRDGIAFTPYRFVGNGALYAYQPLAGGRFNRFITAQSGAYARTAATPDGYSAGGAYVLPIRAGGMSSWQSEIGLDGQGALLSGGPMAGNGDIAVAGAGSMALIISLAGNGAVSIVGAGGLALTIGLAGEGAIAITGAGGLSLVVPIDGTGAFSIAGAADLRGDMSMEGSWGGAAPLSPEGLAQAVWSALATANNEVGTMGAKVNAAGGSGDPWAVTLEGVYTAADLMRLIASVMAGDATGTNQPGTTVFKSLDGTKDRVTATQTEGARTVTALDPS